MFIYFQKKKYYLKIKFYTIMPPVNIQNYINLFKGSSASKFNKKTGAQKKSNYDLRRYLVKPATFAYNEFDDSINLFWGKVKNSNKYIVIKSIDSDFKTNPQIIYNGPSLQFLDTDLLPGTTYYYKVTAIINETEISDMLNSPDINIILNNSDWNNLFYYWSIVTLFLVPSIPSFDVVAINSNDVTATWSQVFGLDGSNFELEIATDINFMDIVSTVPLGSPTIVDNSWENNYGGLTGGLTYYFRMTVIEEGHNIPVWTNVVSVTMPSYKRQLTINHALCGSADSANFTVFLNITGDFIKSIDNGGHVNSDNGYDIRFYGDSDLSTSLTWEIEKYDEVNGILLVWVKIPNVSSSQDTVFYMKYGSQYDGFQGGISGGVWNVNYVMVQHFNNNVIDSTINGNNDSINTTNFYTGLINNDIILDQVVPNYVNIPDSSSLNNTTGTYEFWIKTTFSNSSPMFIIGKRDNIDRNGVDVFLQNGKIVYKITAASSSTQNAPGNISINDGNWHFVSLSFNSLATNHLYIDGVADISSSPTGPWNFTSVPLRIGISNSDSSLEFIGQLDEVRVSNVNRPLEFVVKEYNNIKNYNTFITLGSESFA